MTDDDPTPRSGTRGRLRPSRWSLRAATSAAAAAVVMVAVSLVAGGSVLFLHWVLDRSDDSISLNRAWDVAVALHDKGADDASLLVEEAAEGVDIMQVVGPDGRALASFPSQDRPLPIPTHPTEEDVSVGVEVMGSDGTPYRVSSVRVDTDTGTYVVHAGTERGRDDVLFGSITALVAVFVPVAGAAAALVTWIVMGRVLRPVESIRSRVAEISAAGLADRVPVPDSDDEIARLARTMNRMLARLQAAREAQSAFVGDASHELRSPLSTLSTLLELSSTTRQPVDVATVDDLLLPEVARMRAVVEDLLLLAKSDERGAPLRSVDVDLDDIVLAESARMRGMGGGEITTVVEPARLVGDPDALARSVRNLADNARRYSTSVVALELQVTGSRAVITVDDDGPGVPEPERSRVFDRFARLDADRARESGGSGLGLAIVAETARVHGGTARCEQSPLGGARFVVELPLEGGQVDEVDSTSR